MGSPLSPVFADIFTEAFRSVATGSFSLKPKVWFHNADITSTFGLTLKKSSKSSWNVEMFNTTSLNSSLRLQDLLVTRLPQGRLGHSAYRKSTHTDQYFHASQKSSVIHSLVHRNISKVPLIIV